MQYKLQLRAGRTVLCVVMDHILDPNLLEQWQNKPTDVCVCGGEVGEGECVCLCGGGGGGLLLYIFHEIP